MDNKFYVDDGMANAWAKQIEQLETQIEHINLCLDNNVTYRANSDSLSNLVCMLVRLRITTNHIIEKLNLVRLDMQSTSNYGARTAGAS